MLSTVYERAENECQMEIEFLPEGGAQKNACRDLLSAYLKKQNQETGLKIASRLQEATGNRSGVALLFLMYGQEAKHHRLVLARFPADQGILAETHPDGKALSVRFVEQVFLRSAKTYKSVLYKTSSLATGIWRGRAIDKQINGPREASMYWIDEFLASTLATPGARGTRNLGNAIRNAATGAPTDIKHELHAAVRLIQNHSGKAVTATGLLQQIGVSEEAVSRVRKAMVRPELMEEVFQLDAKEFRSVTPYLTIELDNGAMLSAEAHHFDQTFVRKQVAEDTVTFETTGTIIDERIRRQR